MEVEICALCKWSIKPSIFDSSSPAKGDSDVSDVIISKLAWITMIKKLEGSIPTCTGMDNDFPEFLEESIWWFIFSAVGIEITMNPVVT